MEDGQEGERLASLACALSFASSTGMSQRMEHGLRTAYLGLRLADRLGLPEDDREAIYYGALLKDTGCSSCASAFAAFFPDDELVPRLDFLVVDPFKVGDLLGWFSRNVPLDARFPERVAKFASFVGQCFPVVTEGIRAHCEIAEMLARRLGLGPKVQQALRFQWERWDGRGLAYQKKGDEIPTAAHVLHAAQVFEHVHAFAGPAKARELARDRRGRRFEPSVAEAFLALTADERFWAEVDAGSGDDAIVAARPRSAAELNTDRTDDVCAALGDLADRKVSENWHHAAETAEIALCIGRQLGMTELELTRLRRAALVHDLGQVAVPVAILRREGQLSASEQERFRLHPYYTQRVLERVPALAELSDGASSHHEWVNGQGYHRRLKGEQIPLHGRVIAVADECAHRVRRRGGWAGLEETLKELRASVGSQFDGGCYAALLAARDEVAAARPKPLADRRSTELTERETEVLRLLAGGLSNPQIAEALVLSRRTVEHHLESIYNKLGVSCRTSAVVYAVHHGIA